MAARPGGAPTVYVFACVLYPFFPWNKIMELLAPAGSLETFQAALDCGADAVYLGLDAFNARLRARNFSIKTLSYLIPYAHERKRKVYVTLNTLLRQNELEPVCTILYQLEQIGADALIVADPGLIHIARTHFPRLVLHGSTQMGYHNTLAPRQAASLGLKRIILARELTLPELRSIANNKDVQYEIFVHGALCYSFSGYCLASSFLGGSSGNRGRCTQVCRRQFTRRTTGERGAWFSAADLCTVEHIAAFKAMGFASLKIEGRLRGVDYVRSAVSAYRRAIDAAGNPEEIKQLLEKDGGREKTSFFLGGVAQAAQAINPLHSGTGDCIGVVKSVKESTVTVATPEVLKAKDQLRIHPCSGENGFRATVLSAEQSDTTWHVVLNSQRPVSAGDEIYRVAVTTGAAPIPDTKAIAPIKFRPYCPFTRAILAKFHKSRRKIAPPTTQVTRPSKQKRTAKSAHSAPAQLTPVQELWLRIDTPGWLRNAHAKDFDSLVMRLDTNGISKILSDRPLLSQWRGKVYFELPAFIPDSDLGQWRHNISRLRKAGITRFVCQHVSQTIFFTKRDTLVAGSQIWCANLAARAALAAQGFSLFMHTPEDDVINMGALGGENAIAQIYGHIPLFYSRIPNDFQSSELFSDDRGEQFRLEKRAGFSILTAQHPLCLFAQKDKLHRCGWHRFCIDMSLVAPSEPALRELLHMWEQASAPADTTTFNFRRGLK